MATVTTNAADATDTETNEADLADETTDPTDAAEADAVDKPNEAKKVKANDAEATIAAKQVNEAVDFDDEADGIQSTGPEIGLCSP